MKMDATVTVTIRYSCYKCGLKRIGLEVNARGADEELMDWMQGLAPQLAKDHSRHSPNCSSTTLDELMLPVNESSGGRVGAVAVQ